MGGNVSKAVVSKVSKPIKNYNIVNRAQKRLERQKENPSQYVAPRHPSTVNILKKQSEENPEVTTELMREDSSLIDRVNKLKLEMVDDLPKIVPAKHRPLPQIRDHVLDPLAVYMHPKTIPKGTLSLYQTMTILKKYEADRSNFSSELIAKEYDLERSQVELILRHYQYITLEDVYREEAESTPDRRELDSTMADRMEKLEKMSKQNKNTTDINKDYSF